MIESTPNQRTALIRISDNTNRGRQFVNLTDGVSVVYNANPPITLLQAFAQHAKKHDGNALIPFNGYLSQKNLIFCRHFVLLATSGEYLKGNIVTAGEKFVRGTTPEISSLYTLPSVWSAKKAKMWIQATNITYGEKFDPTPYVLDDFHQTGMTKPLSESLKAAHCTAMIVYDLSDSEEDDFDD